MKCPNCNISLVMTDQNGIEIDYCPECRGVWLDRGELDKIIERSSPQQNNTKYEGHSEKHRYDGSKEYHYKRKKGILGELFDF